MTPTGQIDPHHIEYEMDDSSNHDGPMILICLGGMDPNM